MNLAQLLSNHKETFRQRFIEALAKKTSLTTEQAAAEHKDYIEQYVDKKYKHVERLVERINGIKLPVFLNIRRDRMREDICKLCESNEPNVHALEEKYGNRIEIFEVIEDRQEGALYQIIFHEEAEEKKLPLTAIINRGEVLKFWDGKAVDASVYEMYIHKALAQA